MLLNAVANWLMDFGQWVLGLLPAGVSSGYVVPTSWVSAAQHAMSFVGMFLDMNALAFAVQLVVGYYSATFAVRLIIWLYRVIRP